MSPELEEELDAIQAILLDDVKVEQEENLVKVVVEIWPLTASDCQRQHVGLVLEVAMDPNKYPLTEGPCQIAAKKCKGLGETRVENLIRHLKSLWQGEPVIFDLVEACREELTENNHPDESCAICIEVLKQEEKFVKTQCYHYFHIGCWSRYVASGGGQDCPVCRTAVRAPLLSSEEMAALKVTETESVQFVLTPRMAKERQKRRQLFQRQKAKGGIIDNKEIVIRTREAQ